MIWEDGKKSNLFINNTLGALMRRKLIINFTFEGNQP